MKITATYNIKDHCKELMVQAKKDGILFAKNILFFILSNESEAYAFVGLKLYENSAIMKCAYVSKKYRGNNLLIKLINLRLKWIKDNKPKIKKVYASCTKMSINSHLKCGAEIVKKYNNGITKIKYEIL